MASGQDTGDGRWRLSSRRSPPHDHTLLAPPSVESGYSTYSPPASDHRRPATEGGTAGRPIDGYDVDLFCPPADDKYFCPICMMVLREPVQTQCGHRFCEACIKRWQREKHQCPVCHEQYSNASVFKDNFARREIMSLRVKCTNHREGCQEQQELGHQQDHLEKCKYSRVSCPKGCNVGVLLKDLEQHTTMECPRRDVKCTHCGKEDVAFSEIKVHEDECPEVEVKCRLCHAMYRRKQAGAHKTTCPEERVRCSFCYFGCPVELARRQLGVHVNEAVVNHLQLLTSHVMVMSAAKVYDVTRSQPLFPTFGPHLDHHNVPAGILSSIKTDPGFYSFSSSSAPIFSTASGISLGNLPIIHSIPMEDSDVQISPQISSEYGQVLNRQLYAGSPGSSLEKDKPWSEPLPKSKNSVEAQLRMDITNLHTQTQRNKDKLEKQQQEILHYQSTISRLESHIRDFEGRHCNGVYIWKIKEFRRRKLESVSGKAIVHHSPGFYTSFHGYKMCIRINLNGVESGFGRHLSLFIHLMQGEFDELLKWPFKGKITMSVLDQRDCMAQRKDIVETLIAKPDLAAFLKPTSRRNHKGFGYIEFAPLSVIDVKETFIKNDTLMVKVVVEPSKDLIL